MSFSFLLFDLDDNHYHCLMKFFSQRLWQRQTATTNSDFAHFSYNLEINSVVKYDDISYLQKMRIFHSNVQRADGKSSIFAVCRVP